jgi:hypothetical protein
LADKPLALAEKNEVWLISPQFLAYKFTIWLIHSLQLLKSARRMIFFQQMTEPLINLNQKWNQ